MSVAVLERTEPAVPTDLPAVFESFDDARRASFMAAKNYKEGGGRLAGYLCSYAPLELLDAAGVAAVGLCGMNNETIPDAEQVLPKNLCPLIKGTYGFALTGCPSGGVIQKVGMTIERLGGVVVALDDCSGERTQSMLVDEDADDILRAISDRYLRINCSVMSPNDGRIENTLALCKKYRVDGVVEVVLQACHTFNIESVRVARACEEADIPYIKFETDYSTNDQGQVETRLGAFIEMI